MRWDERSSTTLHRPLLSVCLFHTVTSTQTQSHTHNSFLFLSLVPLLSCSVHHISRTYWHKHFLLALSHTYVRNLQLSHSPSHANTLTYAHLHTFVACPLSICFLLSPHKDCSPLIIPWWADTLWHHCACVRGEEIFSDAMRTSHPADKADGLTGPCRDTHTASAHLLLAQ